jgi:hypothetical protein
LSPKHRHLLPNGTAPTWRAALANGGASFAAFQYDGATTNMNWNKASQNYPALTIQDAFTIYLVCKNTNTVDDGTTATQGTLWDCTSSGTEWCFRYNQSAAIALNGGTGGALNVPSNQVAKLDTNWRIWRMSCVGGTSTIWSQKLQVATSTLLGGASVLGTFNLGARISGQRHFTGYISEFLLYLRDMTTAENDAIHSAWARKYGITLLA